MSQSELSLFHPLIQKWFTEKLGKPTDIQNLAWPHIAQEKHVLITAPTGSGKTLTAFLWAINQLVTGEFTGGQLRILYISPSKALNNDVQGNLLTPLSELESYFKNSGETFPEIRVFTRSGDTPQNERQKMIRRPPEILITTPETLNILLTSKNNRTVLSGILTVILDEIHAVVGNKRGTHLITAVDRLIPLCGEFQRIALSATVKPMDKVAEFVGGYRQRGNGPDNHYEKRSVTLIRSLDAKQYLVKVCAPFSRDKKHDSIWPALTQQCKEIIHQNRATLLFANSRRTAEKVTRLINETEPEVLAYSHHGSLSKEIRLVVEQKLKQGELKAIVATNSLELGIDIGELDQVILVQSPKSISSAIQRVGRSGHRVGEISNGLLCPTHPRDFLDAAILARSIIDQDIEAVIEKIFPDKRGRYNLLDFTTSSGLDSSTLTKKLWKLAWAGHVTNDAFASIRKGILNKFTPSSTEGRKPVSRRSYYNRWKSTRPLVGNWYILDNRTEAEDLLEKTELIKDRIRQLFKRYGILFRELLVNEPPLLQWRTIFRTLRLMELSGEILTGHFFEGIPGLQFISHESYRFLQKSLPEDSVYWLYATDPSSMCGVKLNGLNLPARIPSTQL